MRIFWKITKWAGITLLASATLLTLVGIGTYCWRIRTTADCPVLAWVIPINTPPITASDYIEADAGGGLTRWNPTQVRIYGDGRIDRNTVFTGFDGGKFGCPLHDADQHIRIPASTAASLISHANQRGFCRLCSRYFPATTVSDAGSEMITLSVNGKTKSVWVRAVDAPELFSELGQSIYKLSPMAEFADTSRFNPEREAECRTFHENQDPINEQLYDTWKAAHTQ